MGVQQEIWVKYIIDRLWKDNKFLQFAFNEDQYVIGGSVVHIPQPGSKPTVVKNRSSYPAAAVQRTDTDVTYVLDVYTTDPTHIPDADKYELSYSKMDSVFGDHAGAITETMADDMIIKWLTGVPAGSIVRTTGDLASATTAGQTGNRRVMLPKELQNAKLKLNLQNVAKDGRCALLEDNMADQLFTALSDTQYRDFSAYADAKNGVIGRLHGFDIMTRSTVAMAANATDVIDALGAAVDATDNVVSLCWQKDAVNRAIGTKKFFERKDDPTYYGDVYSALLRMGGRRRRSDNAGIVAIVQAAS
jgi:hypothetical protein